MRKTVCAVLVAIFCIGAFGMTVYANDLLEAKATAHLALFASKVADSGGFDEDFDRPPLYGRTIILDAGHGIGADNVFEGYSEGATMLRLALYITPLLEGHGANVFLTRPTGPNIHLSVRAASINLLALETLAAAYDMSYEGWYEMGRLQDIMRRIMYDFEYYAPTYFNFPFDSSFERVIHPDLYRIFELQASPVIQDNFLMISLHSNATGRPINTAINGVDIYHMTNTMRNSANYFANYAGVERSRLFSEILIDNLDEIGLARRGIRDGNWFIIREHNLPGALVENGFHTNPEDRALLSDDEFLLRLAAAYEDAILRYFAAIN